MVDYSGRSTPSKQLVKKAKVEYVSSIPTVPPPATIRPPAFAPKPLTLLGGGAYGTTASTVSSDSGVRSQVYPSGSFFLSGRFTP